jgi:hypothetical protein
MRIIKPKAKNAGDKKTLKKEEPIVDIKFNIFKNNLRQKPTNVKDIIVISCLSEFGCEIVGCMYCIPKVLRENPGKYVIIVGWYGRDFLYRHLADEFWEVKEEFQNLRDYCRAFHHESVNLARLEKILKQFGKFIPTKEMGKIAVGCKCNECGSFWGQIKPCDACRYCKSKDVVPSFFCNPKNSKKYAKLIPKPSLLKIEQAKSYLGKNPVGIFARGRTTYGRNLQPDFYVDLIGLLKRKGYTPIWLGEKQSTLPCPDESILDFSRMSESRDLELTLAIISCLKFTIQYWTASTRLASIVGTPYLLFESPEQIWGRGQEGYRRELCDFSKNKLCISHFLNLYNDNKEAIALTDRCISEMEAGDYQDVFGMLESDIVAQEMKRKKDYIYR